MSGSTHDLIRIVGKERSLHSPEEVASAERALAQAIAGQRAEMQRRMSKNGAIVAGVGLLVGVWPLCVVAVVIQQVMHGANGSGQPPPSFLWFFIPFGVAALLQTICGFALLAGGIKFRQRSEWGRKMILTVLWIAIGFCVIAGLITEIALATMGDWDLPTVIMLVFSPAITAFFVFLLWQPKKYFALPIVEAFCRTQ